jgi:hypothetical protein
MNPNAAAIYVVGAGVDPGRHLTIEAIEVLGARRYGRMFRSIFSAACPRRCDSRYEVSRRFTRRNNLVGRTMPT